MTVSVVVPAFNEERLLGGSLAAVREALRAFDAPGWSRERIVCDNNSTDRTAAIAREMGAHVVFEPVNQISRARNAGAAAAKGDWLIFVDADSYPSAALFADAREAIESNALAGGATVTCDNVPLAARFALGCWNAMSRATGWAAGAFVFCEAAAFREAGGFSEALYASEEIDLFRKLKRLARAQGRRIAILHEHPLRTSERKIHLYAQADYFAFILKTLVTGGGTLRKRSECRFWYDGRR